MATILLIALALVLLGAAGVIIRWLLRRPVLLLEAGTVEPELPVAAPSAGPLRTSSSQRWPPTIELDLPADSMTLPPAKKLPLKPPARTPLAFAVVVPSIDSSLDLEPPDLLDLPVELPDDAPVAAASGSAPRVMPAVSSHFDDMTVPDRAPHWSSNDNTQPGTRAAALRVGSGTLN
jgi:hypothetical protein